ncbi:hypothetical protein D3C78_1008050 [compost metagenome]
MLHDVGDVIHGGGHADKTGADVAKRQQQNAHPLIVFPHVSQIGFKGVMGWHCRTYTFFDRGKAEQKHEQGNQCQYTHCHLIATRLVCAAKPFSHWQQRQGQDQGSDTDQDKTVGLTGDPFVRIGGDHAAQRTVGDIDRRVGQRHQEVSGEGIDHFAVVAPFRRRKHQHAE